jgi:hypothetical protein
MTEKEQLQERIFQICDQLKEKHGLVRDEHYKMYYTNLESVEPILIYIGVLEAPASQQTNYRVYREVACLIHPTTIVEHYEGDNKNKYDFKT